MIKGSEEFYAAVAIAFAQFQAEFDSKIPFMTTEQIYQDAFHRGALWRNTVVWKVVQDVVRKRIAEAMQAADPLEQAHHIAELFKERKDDDALKGFGDWYRGTLNG
jgi:hypothetical protein